VCCNWKTALNLWFCARYDVAMNHYDVIVLGAGIAGSASAYQLAKQKKKVLLLEQFDFLHKFGSSHGGSRIFRHAYEDQRYVKLAQAAGELWLELEKDADEKLLTRTGGLDIAKTNSHELSAIQRALIGAQSPFEVLSASETTKRFPAFKLRDDQSAIFQQDAGVLAATRCVNAMLRTAAQYGATLQSHESVEQLKLGSTVEVKTAQGVYSAEKLVVCAGPWLGRVLKDLQLPLQVEQQQVLYVSVNNGHLHTPSAMPLFINHDPSQNIYGFPLFDHPTAIKISDHSNAPEITLEERTFEVMQPWANESIQRAQTFLPNILGKLLHFEMCLYTKTPDEHFILDHHPEYKNVAIAGGFSGHGFKFGPVLGEIMSDLVQSGSSKHDLSLFGINRFEMKVAS
jgi:monomeric sarcosine oxidase